MAPISQPRNYPRLTPMLTWKCFLLSDGCLQFLDQLALQLGPLIHRVLVHAAKTSLQHK